MRGRLQRRLLLLFQLREEVEPGLSLDLVDGRQVLRRINNDGLLRSDVAAGLEYIVVDPAKYLASFRGIGDGKRGIAPVARRKRPPTALDCLWLMSRRDCALGFSVRSLTLLSI